MQDPSAPPRATSEGDRATNRIRVPGGAGASDNADESTLVLRAQDGDVLAFAVLLESREPEISALCLEILHHAAEAELIVEETFLTAWRRLDSLGSPEDFGPWLIRMAAHHSLFVLRNRHDRGAASRPQEPPTGPGHAGRRAPAVHVPPAIHAIDSALVRLPVEEHLAWMLHEVDGQSLDEIAEILEVTPERVRERIRRAQRAIVTGMEG